MAKFRARARALDLLGRQLIATVPSAINELFKNSHDAYATLVQADYVRLQDLLIFRDNGIGMTEDDFVNKWLVLGTESKLSEASRKAAYKPAGLRTRPIAGEKGIGRLAVGLLGPQTLIVTRAMRDDGLHPVIVAFVNWSAFAIPNIDLEDIGIPMQVLEDPSELASLDVDSLVKDFRKGLKAACKGREVQGIDEVALKELDEFDLVLEDWISESGDLGFGDSGMGTHLYIQPTTTMLRDAIRPESDGRGLSDLVKYLAGYSNTMVADSRKLSINFEFKDHHAPGDTDDLIREAEFWTPEDFTLADHEVHGSVDKYGHFTGTLRIFSNEPQSINIPYRESRAHNTECGPFDFHVAAIQSDHGDSILDRDEHVLMKRRLAEFAGMYVYRDGLRMLPYGQVENDWLRIEERRNLGAGYYYFSNRNLFGSINVTRGHNPNLREKAGREGFQQNRAYKQLQDIAEKIFIQLAADYFRERDASTQYRRGIKDNTRVQRAAERTRKSKQSRESSLRASIRNASALTAEDGLLTRLQNIISDAESESLFIISQFNGSEAVELLLDLETSSNESVHLLEKDLTLTKPRGISLGRTLQREFDSIMAFVEDVAEPAINQTREMISSIIQSAMSEAGEKEQWRLRAVMSVQAELDKQDQHAKSLSTQVKHAATGEGGLSSRVEQVMSEMLSELKQRIREVRQKVDGFNFKRSSNSEIDKFIVECRAEANGVAQEYIFSLATLKQMLDEITVEWSPETGLDTSLDTIEALDEEVEGLRQQAEVDLELAQLGMAIDIINHEFIGSVAAIRKGLKSLESWTRHNKDLVQVHEILDSNFQHLENFLELFTPLRKRYSSKRTKITGRRIKEYVTSVFYEKIQKHDIDVEFTPAFTSTETLAYASVLLPAFINLVDNSIFWLSEHAGDRKIVIEVDGRDWLISDSGPGIPKRFRTSIFEAGFTTKPGGRGLGLHITQQVLSKNGYEIKLEERSRLGKGATFRISESDS